MPKPSIPALILAILFIAIPLFAQTGNGNRPYNVRIVFIGLMIFDMGDNYKPADPVTVIIPELANGASLQSNQALIPKHVSYLLADRDAMPESDQVNQYYDFQETPHKSDNFIYLPFDGFHISVDGKNDTAAINDRKLVLDNNGCRRCQDNNGDNGKFCWLASIETVKEGKQERDDAHFASHVPVLASKEVAGRLVIRYGALRSYVVGFPGNSGRNEATIFDFQRSGGTSILSQALAQETHWTFRASGLPFVLNLESIKPGRLNERVAFMPTFPDQDQRHLGELTIIIGNTPPSGVGPMENPATPTKDMHYAAYYRFIKRNLNGDGPLPSPEISGNDFVTCKSNIYDPILQTLLAGQVRRSTAKASSEKRAPRLANAKDAKAKTAKAKDGNEKDAKANEQMPMDGQPAPGGLNCSGIRWP